MMNFMQRNAVLCAALLMGGAVCDMQATVSFFYKQPVVVKPVPQLAGAELVKAKAITAVHTLGDVTKKAYASALLMARSGRNFFENHPTLTKTGLGLTVTAAVVAVMYKVFYGTDKQKKATNKFFEDFYAALCQKFASARDSVVAAYNKLNEASVAPKPENESSDAAHPLLSPAPLADQGSSAASVVSHVAPGQGVVLPKDDGKEN